MPPWLNKLGFVIACLAIPILWGWLVNVLFVHWSRRRASEPGKLEQARSDERDDQTFSDYQI